MKAVAVAMLVLLNVALFLVEPRATIAWVHPVAPPLTHIPEMGEPLLGDAEPSAGPRFQPPGPPPGAGGPPPQGPAGPPPLQGLARLVDRAVRSVGTPEQKAATAGLQPADTRPLLQRSMALRVAVQDHAIVIADVLGPERVGVILAKKDTLSTRYGEGRAWMTAIERLAP